MNLVKQNQAGLPELVQKFGCKYRCLQAIAEFSEKRMLSAYDIWSIYNIFAKKNNARIMNANCRCGEDEHVIIDNAFYRLRLDEKRRARMVGSRNAQGETWGRQNGDFIMYHWQTDQQEGHFTLANSTGEEIFDPYNGHIAKKQLIKTLYYQIFER